MSTSNNTQRILKLGIDEIFEDLTYSVAYDEILNRLRNNGMDEGILKDAINSGISIMFSSALMLYLQKQEQYLNLIVSRVWSAVSVILIALRNQVGKFASKFLKGRSASIFSKFLNVSSNERISYANLVVSSGQMMMNVSQSKTGGFSQSDTLLKQKEIIMHSKDQQINYAKAKVDSINQTLLFKLFTSKFTSADKEILRKITGSSDVNIEQINKVASFMFVTDSAGNITGLTEQFLTMLNGLGYFHNKQRS